MLGLLSTYKAWLVSKRSIKTAAVLNKEAAQRYRVVISGKRCSVKSSLVSGLTDFLVYACFRTVEATERLKTTDL
jgi:hypothetical protein